MPVQVRAIDLKKALRGILGGKAMLKQLGETALRLTRERVQAGIGSDGQQMAPYSEEWKEIREFGERRTRYETLHGAGHGGGARYAILTKTGRRSTKKYGGGRQVDHRDLTFTGRMLTARKVKQVSETAVRIGWQNAAEADKAAGNEDRTPFIALTPDERTDLAVMAKQLIQKQIDNDLAAERAKKGTP